MRSSKLPVAVKKTFSGGTLLLKKSPLDQIRDNFEKKRADEKLKIRAIALSQKEQQRQKLLSIGDGVDVHHTVLDKQIDQYHHPFSDGSSCVQKRVPVVDSPAALVRPVLPEKRSAGRDRSHPLEPLGDIRVRRSTSEGLFSTDDENTGDTLPQTLLNNTYTVVKTPPVQVAREQRNYKRRTPTGLPSGKRPSTLTANNLQLDRRHFDSSSTDDILEPSSENGITYGENGSIDTQHGPRSQVSHGNGSAMYNEEPHANDRMLYSPLPHSKMDSENNLASSVYLHDIPSPPTAADDSRGNYLRELRAMRKNKLKQQQKMNDTVVDQYVNSSSDHNHFSSPETKQNEIEEHNQRQYSDLQLLRKQKLQQLQLKTKSDTDQTARDSPSNVNQQGRGIASHSRTVKSDSPSDFNQQGRDIASHSRTVKSDSPSDFNQQGRDIASHSRTVTSDSPSDFNQQGRGIASHSRTVTSDSPSDFNQQGRGIASHSRTVKSDSPSDFNQQGRGIASHSRTVTSDSPSDFNQQGRGIASHSRTVKSDPPSDFNQQGRGIASHSRTVTSDSPSDFNQQGRGIASHSRTVKSDPPSDFNQQGRGIASHSRTVKSDSPSDFNQQGRRIASHSRTVTSDSLTNVDQNSRGTNDNGQSMKPKLPPRQLWQPTIDPTNESTAFFLQALEEPGAALSGELQLVECNLCNRSFVPDRLEKHKIICTKTSSRHRKAFDPTKMRLQGTEFARYVGASKKYDAPVAKKSNWRETHENLVLNLKYARQVEAASKPGGNAIKLPPPPPAVVNPDYVKCPTCNRTFNATSAEKHIPWCKESRAKEAARKKTGKPTKK